MLIIVLLFMLLTSGGGGGGFQALAKAGSQSFVIVAYLQLALICVIAPVFMAGAIAHEANPRTWDIMLTTPMNALQITLGQLLGRLFFVLALLFSSLPLFAVTQYFGGVPGSSVVASYFISASAATLVGAIAIALAVFRLAGRRAVFAFYVTVVTYLGVTFAIDAIISNGGVTVLTPLNPFLALRSLIETTNYPIPSPDELEAMSWLGATWFSSPVTVWAVLSVGLSLILALASTINVRNLGSRKKKTTGKLGPAGERFRGAKSVSNNPIAWRESAGRGGTAWARTARWAFVGAGGLFGLAIVAYYHGGGFDTTTFQAVLLATVVTELLIILLIALNISATAISREREDGTLDLLLTTPITPKEYLGGKLLGIVLYLLPMLLVPMGTVAMASIYIALDGFGRTGGVTVTSPSIGGRGGIELPALLPEAAIFMPIATLAFISICVMIGLQWSLKSKGTIASVIGAVIVAGLVGGVIGLCGAQSGQNVQVVGPALAGLNPISLIRACIDPVSAFESTFDTQYFQTSDFVTARIALAVGSVLGLAISFGVVLGMRSAMTNNFDFTVRKLAGTS
ncbi:MAG: ABC transporter permease subunit [Planctomycetota bacterium]